MKDQSEAKSNPRVIVIQKLYGYHLNKDSEITFPKHRYKKFIKDVVNGSIEREEVFDAIRVSGLSCRLSCWSTVFLISHSFHKDINDPIHPVQTTRSYYHFLAYLTFEDRYTYSNVLRSALLLHQLMHWLHKHRLDANLGSDDRNITHLNFLRAKCCAEDHHYQDT